MGLSRAAFSPGKIPARMPTQTLKLKAISIASTVMTGVLASGERSDSTLTSPFEATKPATPPEQYLETLRQCPLGAGVEIQPPRA